MYTEFFDEYQTYFEELLERSVDLTQLEVHALEILTDPRLRGLFRYLAGPPMPVEYKVSNSEVNSVKRVNNDAAVKAESWRSDLGSKNVVPAAILSGVYSVPNLLDAQSRGLTLIWAHDLQPLLDFIQSTKAT